MQHCCWREDSKNTLKTARGTLKNMYNVQKKARAWAIGGATGGFLGLEQGAGERGRNVGGEAVSSSRSFELHLEHVQVSKKGCDKMKFVF